MRALDRVVSAWVTPRPALVVAAVALAVAGLAAVLQPAPYAVTGLLALSGLAVVAPLLDPPRAAAASLAGGAAVLLVRLLSGGLTGGRAWGTALATVLAVLVVGWAAGTSPPPRGAPSPAGSVVRRGRSGAGPEGPGRPRRRRPAAGGH